MKFLNLLILVVLFPHIDVSSSSSCEEFQNIIYNLPTRSCGSITSHLGNNLWVDCEGNNPIIYMKSTKFLVKDISFENKTFRLVDFPYYSKGGPCHPPNQTISEEHDFLSYFYDFYEVFGETNYNYANFSYLYFFNCTQEIEDSRYKLVPCLNRTNFRVYAMASDSNYDLNFASDMHDSCCLVGRAITEYMGKSLGDVGYAAIVQAIQKGVLVNWTYRSSESWDSCSNIDECLRQFNPWPFEQFIRFIAYEQYYWMDNMGFRASELLLMLRPASFLLLIPYWMSLLLVCLDDVFTVVVSLIMISLSGMILIILVAKVLLPALAVFFFLIHKWWRMSSSVSSIEKFLRRNELLHIRRYDFIEISIMTNNFKEKLGQGGFGSVYKGMLLSGQQVAVKILSNPVGDGDDFISEVATIGMIHHTNIVRLIGFCSEGSKRALVYAYMPNGSLDKYIFSSSNNALSMQKRKEIAIGIARGIDYLHRGCTMQILHFDIKPHNILLDHNLTPKISDFGLAKLYPKDYSLATLSMARGTIGYIAPELISRTFGAISYKADVYSFGMLLMEMVSGRRNVNNHAESSSQVYYPSWVYDQLNLPEEAYNLSINVEKFGEIEERLYKIALWCIQMKASNRPTMSRVIEMLQSDADSVEMPPRPFAAITPHEFSMRPSGNESCTIELSSISEEIVML